MGYSVYWDHDWLRWAGYGVPATCDYPGCTSSIDRGLAYKCESHFEHIPDLGFEQEVPGCGLFFCSEHQFSDHSKSVPSIDVEAWVTHILTDESWEQWRNENPERVRNLKNGH